MMVVRLLSNWGSVTFQGLTSGGPQEILPNLLEDQCFSRQKIETSLNPLILSVEKKVTEISGT